MDIEGPRGGQQPAPDSEDAPDDRLLSTPIADLVTGSAEFAALWVDHRLLACAATEYPMRHPLIGDLTVHHQSFALAHAPEQTLVVVTAEPGLTSQAALTLLAGATAEQLLFQT